MLQCGHISPVAEVRISQTQYEAAKHLPWIEVAIHSNRLIPFVALVSPYLCAVMYKRHPQMGNVRECYILNSCNVREMLYLRTLRHSQKYRPHENFQVRGNFENIFGSGSCIGGPLGLRKYCTKTNPNPKVKALRLRNTCVTPAGPRNIKP